VLAYLFWHRPASGAEPGRYEQALERFHRSLAHRPPAGFRGSAAFRVEELPWLGGGDGYEDWYLVEDWAALGVLEEAAVSRGHVSAHDAASARTGAGTAAVYRLLEGSPELGEAEQAVWVASAPRREPAGLGELLGDGIDPARDGLWRGCLVLGPAPEYCLLAGGQQGSGAPIGMTASRLPTGWTVRYCARVPLWAHSS
jgi:hypothetical protein